MSDDIKNLDEVKSNEEVVEYRRMASRGDRFLASIIDTSSILLITLPTMHFTEGFSLENSWGYSLVIAFVGVCFFAIINRKFLVKDGQTIGKKIMGIKIVDMDGKLPELDSHLSKRYALFFFSSHVPVVGWLFSLINVLFILGESKRCLHDRFAETKVVEY